MRSKPDSHNFTRLLSPQSKQEAGALTTLLALTTRQICDIGVIGEGLSNLTGSLNTTNLNQSTTSLGNSLGNDIGGLGFTLGADDVSLALLLGALDDESCPLGVLLGDLLLLDGFGELLSEGHVGDGDVLQGDVELGGTLEKVCTDAVGDSFTLGDELGGVELGDDSLQNFISDGGKDTLVVIGTVRLIQTRVISIKLLGSRGGNAVASLTW